MNPSRQCERKLMTKTHSFRKTLATAFVVTCMTTLVSEYGRSDQKGTVLGIYRSLGALARALGPIAASIGKRMKFFKCKNVTKTKIEFFFQN